MDEDTQRILDASLAAFLNRKIFRSLDVETLTAIPDHEVELAIVDYASTKIGHNYSNELPIIRSLSVGIQALYSTWQVEAEVNNGGFYQFFENSSGVFAEDAVRGFEFFGLHELASVVEDAIAWREIESKLEGNERKETVEKFLAGYEVTRLGEYDRAYSRLEPALRPTRVRPIRNKPELFVGS